MSKIAVSIASLYQLGAPVIVGWAEAIEYAMTNRIHRLVNDFASRKYLRARHEMGVDEVDGTLCLSLDSPVVLARFATELRQALLREFPSAALLCRGQTNHTAEMRPSLFREENEGYEVSLLCQAEDLLVRKGKFGDAL